MTSKFAKPIEKVEIPPDEMIDKMVAAILKNDVGAINALIVKGADVNASDKKGNSLLLIAATDPREHRSFEALLAAGADPNRASVNGRLPIHAALRMKDDRLMPAALETLFKAKADPNTIERRDGMPAMTPLQVALEQNRNDRVLETLLKNGADPTKGEDQAQKLVAPIHALAHQGRYVLLEIAHRNGFDLNHPASDGTTALMIAAREGALKTVEVLIDCDADPTLTDRRSQDAIALAHKSPPETDKRSLLKMLVRAAREHATRKDIAKLRAEVERLRKIVEKPA